MSLSNFIRVTKSEPCLICGKPDWCLISRDRTTSICTRVSAGSFKKTKGGWCHRLTAPSAGLSNFRGGFSGRSTSSPPRGAGGDEVARFNAPIRGPGSSLSNLLDSLSRNFKCKPSGNWVYREADGTEAMRVIRFDPPEGGKQYRPLAFDAASGRWRVGDPPDRLLPLYRLNELRKSECGMRNEGQDAPSSIPQSAIHTPQLPAVWVCEGEKCADAAVSVGLNATTSAHGAAAAERTDFSPLAGREVIIVPDNDSAGGRYAQDVCRMLLGLEPRPKVKIVQLPGLEPAGDLFDWLEARDSTESEALKAQLEQMAAETVWVDPSVMVGGPQLVALSSVQSREVRWLWPSRIARGKLTLLAGDPGVGKSFLTLDLAARVSTGADFPDDSGNPSGPGHVVLISAEDDLEDTVHPRLAQAGADMSRITWLAAVRQMSSEGQMLTTSLTLQDLAPLRETLSRIADPRLVVIDPVSAYMGDCDGNNNAQVRGILGALSELAREYACAVVMVTHLNKTKDSSVARSRSLYRAMGSLAFVAAARCAMLACKDPKDGSRRLLLPMKNNIGNDSSGLAWRIEEGKVSWDPSPIELTADDAVNALGFDRDGAESPVLQTVAEWMRERLGCGVVAATTMKQEAAAKGFSMTTLERARLALGVVTRKQTGGPHLGWVWAMSEEAITGQMKLEAA